MSTDPTLYDTTGNKVLFNLFRKELAIAAEIIKPENYFGTPDDGIDWKHISKMTDYFGHWIVEPKDPIWYLLAHSDSAGIIKHQHLAPLIKRLLELKKQLPGVNSYPNWQTSVTSFIKHLKLNLDAGNDIQFK